jgi:hypothetical protein
MNRKILGILTCLLFIAGFFIPGITADFNPSAEPGQQKIKTFAYIIGMLDDYNKYSDYYEIYPQFVIVFGYTRTMIPPITFGIFTDGDYTLNIDEFFGIIRPRFIYGFIFETN